MSHFNYSSTGFSPKFNHKVTRPKSAHHSFAHSTIKNPDLYIESLKSKASLHKPSSTQIIGLQSDEVFQFVEPKSLQPKEYHISLVPSGEFPSANSYFHQAYKHRSRGDFQNALTYYRQALNIDPKHLPSRINVGVCMMKLNMIEAAIENFQTAEGMHPYEPISYFNRVICHLSLGEYDQAIDGINTSLAFLSQEEMKDYVSLKALALFRAGKVADAIDVSKNKNESAKMKEDDVVKRAYNSLFPHKVNKDFLSFRRPSTNSGVRKLLSESKPNIGISKLELGKHQKVSSARTVSSLIGSTRVSTAVNTQRIKKPVRLSSANPKLTLSVPRKSFLTGTHELPCESKEALATPKSKEINTIKSVEELPTYEELLAKKKMFDTMIAESEAVINSIVPIHRKRDNIVDKEIGFFQDDLQIEATDYKEEILHNQHKKNRTAKIRRDIERDVEASKKIFYDESTLVSEILTAKISIQSLKFIQNEFEKPFEARDYSELEKMLSKLPFFAKFPGGVRVQLLKRCEFRIFQKEDYIIRQGDPGDYMFVIISGAIEIRKVSPDFGMLDITINSMYDGETFGELALLADPAGISIKRTASCLANERTLLIALAKEDYKHILLEQMQNDIIGKVDFFKKLPIFQDSEGLSLIPLASNIEPVTYKINEPLILQGEKPQGLYIIYKGRCTVY